MDPGSADGGEKARHLDVIAESERALREYQGSDDPVAIRQVSEALSAKARALRLLERFEEYVVVCDEMLAQPDQSGVRRLKTLAMKSAALAEIGADEDLLETVNAVTDVFDELERPDRLVQLVAKVAVFKIGALGRLERVPEAIRADDELVDRFADRHGASEQVSTALCDKASHLLKTPERLDEALAVSERLRERLESEPDDTLAPVALIVLEHLRVMAAISSPTVKGVAVAGGLFLGNLMISVQESARESLSRRQPATAPAALALDRLGAALSGIGPLDRSRRRLRQCLLLSRALIQRVGATEDPELRRLAAVARATESSSLTTLGHLREGTRAFETLSGGEEAGAPQGLQMLASASYTPNFLGQLGRLAFLRVRAEALGGGDNAVAQIAFDDSVSAVDPDMRNTRLIRWAARLLRFQANAQIVVPDHPPENNT